ncbi:MAG: pilin [Candidatus Uhrbacteria bacterium]|nr:pilin [Candidatus Uhrbacteria bacterium]
MSSQRLKYFFLSICLLLLPQLASAELINPLGSGITIESFIGRLIKFLLGLSGSVALLMFVWGGFQYLWSGGDPKKVEKGKETLKNAVLGIVIIFFAYTLVNSLIKVLSSGALT